MSDRTIASQNAAVDGHMAAEARLGIDQVLAGYADEFEHEIVGDPAGVITTRDGLRERYTTLLGALNDPEFHTIRRLHGDGFVVDESALTAKVDGVLMGLEGKGRTIRVRVLHVFMIRDGRIALEQGWVDSAALAAQLA